MNILSARQTRDADRYTIENEPISSLDLMERASTAFKDWFINQFDATNHVLIVAGTGNNGGDALVISRLLYESGYKVTTLVIRGGVPESEDFTKNYRRLSDLMTIQEISNLSDFTNLDDIEVVVEGIFGSGLSRPLEGLYLEVVEYLNSQGKVMVSIDIPSGLFADEHTEDASIEADYTVSFQRPKLSFLMAENESAVGQWTTVDIGLDEEYIASLASDYVMISREMVQGFIKKRKRHSHKGTFGKAMMISGSLGKVGAAVLTSRAAIRSGLGLLTVHAPSCGYEILQTSVPEAMVSVDSGQEFLESFPPLEAYDVVGIGPGIGTETQTQKMVGKLLNSVSNPMVIDADALNILSMNKKWIQEIPEGSILTPHVKEFERISGTAENDFERLKKAREFSSDYNVIIVLKGAFSAICCPEGKVFFNSSGNPGMATGGSGDALTGILMGLLAQNRYSSQQAAILGVYLHGLAGDFSADRLGKESLIASDIIDALPNAFQSLFESKDNQ